MSIAKHNGAIFLEQFVPNHENNKLKSTTKIKQTENSPLPNSL